MQSTYFNLIRRYATWIACGVGIPLGLVSLRAEETTRTIDRDPRTNWLPNTSDQEAARAKPHPWLTDAPPALARLVDRGNVQMIFCFWNSATLPR